MKDLTWDCSPLFSRVAMLSLILPISLTAFAESAGDLCAQQSREMIGSIKINGLQRTQEKVVLRELGLQGSAPLCPEEIEAALARVRRTGLFRSVTSELKKNPDDSQHSDLHVQVQERWTTIPIFKFNSGGGVAQYTLGVYDPNIGGHFLEAGAQYENLGGAGSGVLWFKNPRLADQPQGLDLQYWNTKRIRIKYDQEAQDAVIKRGFLHERERLFAEYSKAIRSELTLRTSLDYNRDQFSADLLPDAVVQKQGTNPELPPSTKLALARVGADLGRIDGEAHALEGLQTSASVSYARSLRSESEDFSQLDLSLVYFKKIPDGWQFAQRALAGFTSTQVLQYWYYLGGLDRIRGFADNRFSGRQFVLSNSEIRYLIKEKSWAYVQGVAFCDLAAIGERSSELTTLRAASAGAGLRVILPQFYRFVVRLDYARPLLKTDQVNWSFGVQQFF